MSSAVFSKSFLLLLTVCVGPPMLWGFQNKTIDYVDKVAKIFEYLQDFFAYIWKLLFFTAFKIHPSASQFFAFSSEHLN